MELTILNDEKRYQYASMFLAVFFLAVPFYLWSSGIPQLSHLLAFVGVLLVIRQTVSKDLLRQEFMILMVILIVYSCIVNVVFSLIYAEMRPLLYPLYYLYCLLFCSAVYVAAKHRPYFLYYVYCSIILGLAVQVCLSFVFLPEPNARYTILFNNPNQLGYYAMLSTLIITLIHERVGIGKWLFYSGLCFGLYLGFLSNSKAIIYGNFLFVFGYAISSVIKKNIRTILLLILIALISYNMVGVAYRYSAYVKNASLENPFSDKITMLKYSLGSGLDNKVLERIRTTGADSDDNLAGRGYKRITEHYEYLIFGAGEGLNARFDYPKELHSTFGTLLFCYGLVGVYIVVRIVYLVLKTMRWESLIYFVPLGVYSLTHNGLRSPLLWVLLMLVIMGEGIMKKSRRCRFN